MAVIQQISQLEDRAILGKATKNAATALGLRLNELAEIIGVDRSTLNRGIDPKSKTGDIALTFIRCYRALHALFGGDVENIKYWFATYNKHLNGAPKDLVKNIQGLGNVVRYLDGMRGKI
ncbi:MAG: MbcA/ParS/Xre antitoxin family protein [Sneathiella sp.]